MKYRTRTLGELEKAWYKIEDFTPPGVSLGHTITTSEAKSRGNLQTTSDVVIDKYLSRTAKGEVFMNPLTISKTTRSTDPVVYTFGNHPSWGTRVISGMLPCVWSIPPVRPAWFDQRKTDAAARTLLIAHSKVAEETFLSLVTVREAGKTAKMIAGPFEQARSLIKKVYDRVERFQGTYKGGSRNPRDLAKATVSAWNEYRFGWKPVVLEIAQIWDAYMQNLVMESKPVRLVARSSDRDIVWDSVQNVSDNPRPGVTNVKMVANYSHRSKVSSGVLYELHDETLADATARRMGFRLSDVPSTIWELTSLSFVVDRFLDVGVWLQAITPKPGVRVLGSWTTTLDYQLNFHQVVDVKIDVATSPATTYRQKGGNYSEEIQTISRVANPTIPPLPTVNYRDLSLVQQIDHVALISQRLLGLKLLYQKG